MALIEAFASELFIYIY